MRNDGRHRKGPNWQIHPRGWHESWNSRNPGVNNTPPQAYRWCTRRHYQRDILFSAREILSQVEWKKKLCGWRESSASRSESGRLALRLLGLALLDFIPSSGGGAATSSSPTTDDYAKRIEINFCGCVLYCALHSHQIISGGFYFVLVFGQNSGFYWRKTGGGGRGFLCGLLWKSDSKLVLYYPRVMKE